MIAPLPIPGTPVLANKLFAANWQEFFRNVAAMLGQNKDLTVWDGSWIPSSAMDDVDATVVQVTLDGGAKVLGLPTGVNNILRFEQMLPNNYRAGQPINVYPVWAPEDATAGNVRFRYGYSYADEGDVFSTDVKNVEDFAAPGAISKMVRSEFSTNIPGTGLVPGSVLSMRLERRGGHANDTYGGSAGILGVALRWPIAGIGSETEF